MIYTNKKEREIQLLSKSNANSIYGDGYGLNPPLLQFSADSSLQTDRPCNVLLPLPENGLGMGELGREMNRRQKLKDSYTRQTIRELITLNSGDNQGSKDPYTQFIHTLFSPADEFDKGIDSIQDLPGLLNSLDNAFSSGDPNAIQEAAEKTYDAYNNLPSKPGIPIPKKGDDVKTWYDNIKKIYELFASTIIEDEIGHGECDREEQVRSGIGKVVKYNFLWNTVDFISTKGEYLIGAYSDLPTDQWWQAENGDWYINADYLPIFEAKR